MKTMLLFLISLMIISGITGCQLADDDPGAESPGSDEVILGASDLITDPPSATVKICFMHHSVGSHWIQSGLGETLNENNYYLTDTDYGWDALPDDNLGNRTNTDNWNLWFNDTVMPHVYANSHEEHHENTIPDPGGENEIIIFKSCYPNSEVGSSIDDEKILYNELLSYFAAHPDKLFILIIPPPEIVVDSGSLTRELSNWLVDRENGWLSTYSSDNVYAFNYYNILTDPNNHHRINGNNQEENFVSANPVDADNPHGLYYPMGPGNDHPGNEGHNKATEEFIELLNGWYHLWR